MVRPSSASDLDHRAQHQAGRHVETRERFVEHDQLGIVQQRRRQLHLLPHALREGGERRILIVLEAEQLHEALDLRVEHGIFQAAKTADQAQIFGCGEVGVEKRLFRNVAELLR